MKILHDICTHCSVFVLSDVSLRIFNRLYFDSPYELVKIRQNL